MNVSLTPKLEQWIAEKVSSGLYTSASEVVREAIRLLQDHQKLRELRVEELRHRIAIGIDQLDRGYSRPFDANLLNKIKQEGRNRIDKAHP